MKSVFKSICYILLMLMSAGTAYAADPVITTTAGTSATEDVTYMYNPSATDDDGDTLTWSLSGAPVGMNFNSSTGAISWIPGEGVTTPVPLELTVFDGNGGTDTENWTISVTPVNDAPQIITTAGTSATEDVTYTYNPSATDDDGDILTWSLANEPSGMSINPSTGAISWTPGDVSTSGTVTLTVDDNNGGTDTEQFAIVVTNVNDIPEIISTAGTVAQEDTEYMYIAEATDADPADKLTWSLSNEPAGMKIKNPPTGSTAEITWTPAEGIVSSGAVSLTVDDNQGGTDTETWTITVTTFNDAPQITSVAPLTATEDVEYTYTPTATDPDVPADILTWSLANEPAGMTIVPSTGAISWTPAEGDTTSVTVTLTVDDNNGGTDSEVFTISVTADNGPPEITSSAPPTAIEDVEYIYNPTATDPDIPPDTLTWSLTNQPLGMTIVSSTGEISWTPGDVLTSGTVTLTASDNKGGTDTEVFTIAVTGVNDAPQITSKAPSTATEDVKYTYNPTATDPDIPADTLTWSLSGAPAGMSFNLSTGAISWTPGEGITASGPLTLTVTDGNGGTDTENWTIIVTAVNDAPQITSEAWTAANTGVEYRYTATATDVDNDDNGLEWTLVAGSFPDGMRVLPAIGSSVTVSWTPGPGIETSELVRLTVSDGTATTTQKFTIAVTDKPVVVIDSVEQVTTTTATVNAMVVAAGIPPAEAYGICWGESEVLTVDDDCSIEGPVSAVGPYARELTGLTLGETYYVRAYAANDTGSGLDPVYSEVVAFQTHFPPKATLSGTPAPLTKTTTYSLQVDGIGVVSYRYRIDGGPWSDEWPVNQKIVENNLGEGLHSLQVIGKAQSATTGGVWQADQDATEISWVVDTTLPIADIVNHPGGTVGPFGNGILVQGDEVAVYSYSLDGGLAWSTAYPVSVPLVLPDLNAGGNTLSVVGADFAGNWQSKDNATTIEWIVDAGVPTALLTDLPDVVTNEESIDVGVTTPEGGVPVKEYYYRIDDSDWNRADVSQTITESWGAQGEGEHTLCVNAGDGEDVWQDGADGKSSIDSATCYTWRIDLTPATVAGLTVENTEKYFKDELLLPASKSVKLSWTWESTDPAKAIERYRVWYSLSAIDPLNPGDAVELFCNIIPGKKGFVESMIIDGLDPLDPNEEYSFAVSAVDRAGNESELSVYNGFKTLDIIPEIYAFEIDEIGGLTTENSMADALLISGANFIGTIAGNLVRFENDTTSFELSSEPGTAGEISVGIPLGTPTGRYRIRVINKFGVSLSRDERVVITEAEIPLPAVRSISPLVVSAGTATGLTITGDNFSQSPTAVNLLDSGGVPLPLTDIVWIDPSTITATLTVDEDFPKGRYHIQVVNADEELNTMSAAMLEIDHPMDLNDESGAAATSCILRLKDGLIPAYTFLNSDDGVQHGAPKRNIARIAITLEPGTVFEMQDGDDWAPYEGDILPPRMVSPAPYMNSGIGSDIVAFSMGASQKIRMAGDTRMFVVLEVTLPDYIDEPLVYQVESDGSLVPAGVSGTWQGLDIIEGGTILAERFNVPQTKVTTFTLGVLLDHMSEYVIGSEQGAVPLPEPDTMGASDEYGVCFIGAADATPRGGVHYVTGLVVLIVGAVFLLIKRYHRALTAFLLLIALTGFVFTAPAVRAAEGAAAEPTADTEEEGIAIPGETETELEAVDILKGTETGYVPVAASSVRKRARRNGGERHWNIHAGLGYAYIGQEDTAIYDDTEVKHKLNGDLYPILGVSYAFSKRWALEFSLHRDFYSGEISNSISGSSSKLEGITANLAALFLGGPYTWSWIGTYRPYGLAGLGYRTLDGDLDYPVTSYKPAIGAVLGIGMLKGKWDFRLGYSFFKHDADSTQEGYTGSGDELDTSGIYLEVAYHFLKY